MIFGWRVVKTSLLCALLRSPDVGRISGVVIRELYGGNTFGEEKLVDEGPPEK
jgi:hypothetical protein